MKFRELRQEEEYPTGAGPPKEGQYVCVGSGPLGYRTEGPVLCAFAK